MRRAELAGGAAPAALQPVLLAGVLTRLHRLPVPSVVMAVRAHSAGYRARLARVPAWLPALERGCWPAASPPIAGSLAIMISIRLICWGAGPGSSTGSMAPLGIPVSKWPASSAPTAGRMPSARHWSRAIASGQGAGQPARLSEPGLLPWVDYIGLLWALLMAEQQPGPDYQALIDLNRQRLE